MTPQDAQYWIHKLQLSPHPEGGYYRQTYRSDLTIARAGLPPAFPGDRQASTAIYFLLEGKNFSAFHRLRSDEVWHFYAGAPLVVHVISPSGDYSIISLGADPDAGQVLQAVVPAGCWFASHVVENAHPPAKSAGRVGQPSWSLVGCTVSPGFEFEDFELAEREQLANKFPCQRQIIERLTRH